MSTWQILDDSGNSFRWEISDHQLHLEPHHEPLRSPAQQPPHRLPSMDDLLLQGCTKLMDNGGDHEESPPMMFRTGLGKSVVVNKSSMSRALSIIGDEDDPPTHTNPGQLGKRDDGFGFPNSMFQTGSGKAVKISSEGLVRAKTLLGLKHDHDFEIFPGFENTRKQSNSSVAFGRWQTSSHLGMTNAETNDATSVPTISSFISKSAPQESKSKEVIPDYGHSAPKPPSVKFSTAGGTSISVSEDALQRARNLLGDPEVGAIFNEKDPVFSISKERISACSSWNKENDPDDPFSHQETAMSKLLSNDFKTPMQSNSYQKKSLVRSENIGSGSNLIKKFDAAVHESTFSPYSGITSQQKPVSNRPHALHGVTGDFWENGFGSRVKPLGRSLGRPLTDISNTIVMGDECNKQASGEKRQFGRVNSISPFKKPRVSKFVTPLNKNSQLIPNGISSLAREESCCKRKISGHYPFQAPRKYLKEYFEVPPFQHNMLKNLPGWVRKMNPENADKYLFQDGSGLGCIGLEAFYQMLANSGASVQYVSKEWVANHYKWIVWKLACLERCYSAKSFGKFLTVSNVLEELKYRYEREVNHGHRSAIKRMLEGDAPPSSLLILCISSIHAKCDEKTQVLSSSDGGDNNTAAKIELTDGWYSVNALLDILLSKKLAAGKLFVGQKLRIWGAGLCGWAGPVSPVEVSSAISLRLHINGTYRAHWADRLGFCKSGGPPLAFRCIKGAGGAVPSTLVGVLRVYPVLYGERLSDGKFVVRSERMETEVMQQYNQRCSTVAEGIMSEFPGGTKELHIQNEHESDEGAKILKILETAAEPEVLMAEMSPEQLNSFATYQAKLEVMRQTDVHNSIQKALDHAGLSGREVTPFMRVRVVGLNSKTSPRKCCQEKGLITIWNPSEKQKSELVEGQAYAISGLVPQSSDSDTLYLRARGSTTKWKPLSPSESEHFQSFFSPRKPISMSGMGEVSLSSEFDIAAVVIYVGEVNKVAKQAKQWVFVADGSIAGPHSEGPSNALLAISFSSPSVGCDSFVPINYNLAGSTVGFCNLIKRAKDTENHLWVAEATENSTYFLSYEHVHSTHLKDAASSAQRWAKLSRTAIERLRGEVLSIIGKCEV